MRSNHQALQRVSIGTGMMLASVILLFVYILASMFFVPIARSLGNPELAMTVFRLQLRAGAPIFMTSMLLASVGPCLCLAAPKEAKATTYVLLSVMSSGLAFLIRAINLVANVPSWIGFAANSLPILAIFFFVLFLIRLAGFLDRTEIATCARRSIILAIIAAVSKAIPTTSMFIFQQLQLGPDYYVFLLPLTLVPMCVSLIATVISFMLYLRALEYTRSAIGGERRPGPMTAKAKAASFAVGGAVIGGLAGCIFYALTVTSPNPLPTVLGAVAVGGIAGFFLSLD